LPPRAQLEEGVRAFLDLAEKHLIQAPLHLIDENDSVALVFVEYVLKREHIRLAPARFDPAMRQIHYRQVYL